MKYRVLLVENKDSNLESIKQELKLRGYEIVEYQKSAQIKKNLDPNIHLLTFLIMDITEPFLKGYKFIEELNNRNIQVKKYCN